MKNEIGGPAHAQRLHVIQEEHGGSEMLNIAPRKPNWDLKRDVAKKVILRLSPGRDAPQLLFFLSSFKNLRWKS